MISKHASSNKVTVVYLKAMTHDLLGKMAGECHFSVMHKLKRTENVSNGNKMGETEMKLIHVKRTKSGNGTMQCCVYCFVMMSLAYLKVRVRLGLHPGQISFFFSPSTSGELLIS